MKNLKFGSNLKFLRKSKNLKQAEILDSIGFKPTTWSGYETEKSFPKFEDLIKISEYFDISIDSLVYSDLQNVVDSQNKGVEKKSKNVVDNVVNDVVDRHKYAPVVAIPDIARFEAPKVVTVDSAGRDNVVFVPVKAMAGYLTGYGDPEFIGSLQSYSLPGMQHDTFRIFETRGLSMHPTLQDRDAVVCRYATTADFKDDRIYVIVTKNDGILVKRCLYNSEQIICKSDNMVRGEYPNVVIDMEDVLEVWYVVMRWTRHLPAVADFYKRFANLESKVIMLENHLKPS